ncbi:hypothetical protein AYL99_11160 [Fonsecaea erecta]|uniref:Uncharacterized protein n=1 Tax=Fonsecaea erecta TaxID=1367422 RepID=A0A178Z4R6_9EURO|nr:hypothetical protein AYL99_11160 [Fonsecaea erecta]OAP54712.1 hypothetical protein AYL99_11160 [Fonsecaea erecta]
MSKSSWSITSTKRKTESGSSVGRKRQRRSGTDVTSTTRPSKSQRTLTQAQWITTIPPSCPESDMQYLDDEQKPTLLPKKTRRSVRNPNSTLTQMDFFSSVPQDYSEIDDAMISVEKGEDGGCAVPQLDGTYDSPRRPRKRKATPSVGGLPTNQKTEALEGDSQKEYKPCKRKRKRKVGFAGEENSEGPLRASKRLALKNEVLSDPAKNFDYFSKALGDVAKHDKYSAADEPFDDFWEIKDTLEDEAEMTLDVVPKSGRSVLPRTPKGNATVILSSQSPESICESPHKSKRKAPDTPSRTRRPPLAERPVNIPAGASPTRKGEKRGRAPSRDSSKSKMVALKLPKLKGPRRPPYVENSQKSVWSIPSSSPELIRKPAAAVQAQATPYKVPEDCEIPATSQPEGSKLSSLVAGCEDNLPNLSELVTNRSGDMKAEGAVDSPQEGDRGAIVRDFADAHSPPAKFTAPGLGGIIGSSPPVPAETQDPKEPAEDSEESCEAADFGSPIANDTQFNMQIQHRVRPEQSLDESEAGLDAVLLSTLPTVDRKDANMDAAAPCSAFQDIGALRSSESPSRIPRLVERCNADADREAPKLGDDDVEEATLPKPVFVHPSSVHRTATQAPLNDTMYTSSSPLSVRRLATQRSIHPASIPHPSQISTQDATQCFLPLSSLPPQPQDGVLDGEPDKITIKDSSSSSIRLSQIPQHLGHDESPLNGDDNAGPESTSEDDLDLDLDPPSLPPRQPPRPQAAVLEQENTDDQLPAVKSRSGPGGGPPSELESTASHASPELSSSPLEPPSTSPARPPPLQREYSPIPGFNNDTQSNFTQDGHVTAAYIHRQRESGIFPKWFVPTPYQVPGYTRRK